MRVAIVVRVGIIEHEVAIVGESDDNICLSCNDFLSVRVAVDQDDLFVWRMVQISNSGRCLCFLGAIGLDIKAALKMCADLCGDLDIGC